MKLLTLLSLYLLLAFSTHAQALSWLHGDWTGETYFPNGSITKRIIVKMRVTKVTGNHFEALLDNLYPDDTTTRLERKITGSIINKQMRIESSEQVYIRDPRTQSFWRDCTGCDIQSAFRIGAEQVEIKLKTTNCSDECNGETTFSRDTSVLNPSQQKDLAKWFRLPVPEEVIKAGNKQAKDTSVTALTAPVYQSVTDTTQKQKTNTKDSLPDTQRTQKAIEKDRKESSKPTIALLAEADRVTSSSSAKPGEPVSDTLRKANHSVSSKTAIQQKSTSQVARKKDTVATAAINSIQANKDSLAKQRTPAADSTPSALTTRTTNLVTTFRVSSPHIVIQLFDNAEIDGDVVTVYHNGQMIANRQSLTHKAITITIDASKENAHHEFIMTADNLGLIPPNTALMRITAGSQKFELEVSSDFDNNSKIAIDYMGE